jgi:Peptidase family M1 domain
LLESDDYSNDARGRLRVHSHVSSHSPYCREQYLIVDKDSHHRELVESVRVTSHEIGEEGGAPCTYFNHVLARSLTIAHQFFGNAVTCEWWSYLWMQEGLATVFEYLLPEAVLPDYQTRQLFSLQLQNGLRVDAVESVRPMTNVVDKNEQLPGLFDRITYDKCESLHAASLSPSIMTLSHPHSRQCFSDVPARSRGGDLPRWIASFD